MVLLMCLIRCSKAVLDQYWLYTALALIGESFQADGDICGSVVSIRKPNDKIALWTRDSDAHSTKSIGYVENCIVHQRPLQHHQLIGAWF
jgi:hypothetical protein